MRYFFFRASGGSSPGDESLLFRQKGPKPLTPRLAFWEGRDANFLKSGPTRQAQTGAARCEECPSLGQPAGVGSMGHLLIGAFARLADVQVVRRWDLFHPSGFEVRG